MLSWTPGYLQNLIYTQQAAPELPQPTNYQRKYYVKDLSWDIVT